MRWLEDTTLRFVELYREHECLWNVAIPEYRDKWIKQMAYEHMVQEMGIDGFDVSEAKQKIKNLRCTYNQELIKIQKSKGPDSTQVYVPNIKWFVIMDSFVNKIREKALLRRSVIAKQRLNSIITVKKEGEQVESGEEEYIEYLDDTTTEENDEPSTSTNAILPKESKFEIPDQDTTQDNNSPFSFIACGVTKKRKIHETAAEEEQLRQRRASEENDECDAFGKYISLSLKKLPLQLSIQAQQEIQDTLTRFRLLAVCSADSNVVATTSNSS